jgi:hypothetical protein
MTIQTGPATDEELLRKPYDGFRCELVRGELRKMSGRKRVRRYRLQRREVIGQPSR